MNAGQIRLYRFEVAEWVKACRKLGRPCDDAARYALHASVGAPQSSKDFTQDNLTRVIAKMRSFSQPGNFNAQMHAEEDACQRILKLKNQIGSLQLDCRIDGGLNGVARYFSKWLGGKSIDQLDERTLQKLLGIMERRKAQCLQENAAHAKKVMANHATFQKSRAPVTAPVAPDDFDRENPF